MPVRCEHLTSYVDVGQKLLFYAVCAWEPDFTGYVVDYGTYPQQALSYFTTREVERTLRRVHPGTGVEGAVYAGLEALCGRLLGQEWKRDDGAVMRIGLCFVDQGWLTDVVHQSCRQSKYAALLMPARRHGVTASQKPISEYDRKRGDRIGHHWFDCVVGCSAAASTQGVERIGTVVPRPRRRIRLSEVQRSRR